MSSKVLEGAMGFWVIAILSLSAISSFDGKAAGVASAAEASNAQGLLSEISELLGGMNPGDMVTVAFPSGPTVANLTLSGATLWVQWGSGNSSVRLASLSGLFSLPLQGTIQFSRSGSTLEARRLG